MNRSRGAIFLIILCSLLYANALFNGFAWDDRAVITENSLTRMGLRGIGELVTHDHFHGYNQAVTGLYRPIPLMTHAIEYEVAGMSAFTGHLVNLLLYILACVSIFYAMLHWFPGRNLLLPLVAVMLFAVHPLHTEVVANIKGRDELLNTIFLSLSVVFSFRYIQRSTGVNFILCLFFFLLGLLSKESAMTFLAVIPLSMWFFSHASLKKVFFVFAGLTVAALFYLLLRSQFVESPGGYRFFDGYHQYCTSRPDRLATSTATLLDYLKLLFIPYPLVYDYSYNQVPVVAWTSMKAIVSLAVHLLLIIFALTAFPRKNILAFCILFYVITLSVFANIITPTSAIFAERFLFIPSMAFSLALSWSLLKLFRIPDALPFSFQKLPPARKYLYLATLITLLISAGTLTVTRNKTWKDDFTLFTTDLVHLQGNARAHYNVATWYVNKTIGDAPETDTSYPGQAIRHFNRTVAIDPGFTEAWSMLGILLNNRKNYPGAIEAFRKAEETAKANTPPQYSREMNRRYAGKAWFSLGMQAFSNKEYKKAANCFLHSAGLDPSNSNALLNTGACHYNLRQYDSAAIYYQKTVQVNPGEANAWHGLGLIALSRNRLRDAVGFFRKAADSEPGMAETYREMGVSLQ